jgi:hypothetical protein
MPQRKSNQWPPAGCQLTELNQEDRTLADQRTFVSAADEAKEKGVDTLDVRDFLSFEIRRVGEFRRLCHVHRDRHHYRPPQSLAKQ